MISTNPHAAPSLVRVRARRVISANGRPSRLSPGQAGLWLAVRPGAVRDQYQVWTQFANTGQTGYLWLGKWYAIINYLVTLIQWVPQCIVPKPRQRQTYRTVRLRPAEWWPRWWAPVTRSPWSGSTTTRGSPASRAAEIRSGCGESESGVKSELISFLQQQKVSLDCDPLRGVGVISPECLKCLSVTQKTRPPYLWTRHTPLSRLMRSQTRLSWASLCPGHTPSWAPPLLLSPATPPASAQWRRSPGWWCPPPSSRPSPPSTSQSARCVAEN